MINKPWHLLAPAACLIGTQDRVGFIEEEKGSLPRAVVPGRQLKSLVKIHPQPLALEISMTHFGPWAGS